VPIPDAKTSKVAGLTREDGGGGERERRTGGSRGFFPRRERLIQAPLRELLEDDFDRGRGLLAHVRVGELLELVVLGRIHIVAVVGAHTWLKLS
jgi:hypothetical protein